MTGVRAPKPPVAARQTVAAGLRAAAALRRSRMKPVRLFKLRLIDAVALAAGGLLILKLTALLHAGLLDEPGLPAFGRVIAKARTGYQTLDPATTGSVTAKEPEKAPERPAEPPRAQPPMPEPLSQTERVLLGKLGARRDALKQRGEELDVREKLLNDAERKLESGLGDLRQAEDKADSSAKGRESAEKQGMKSIVIMYEAMKPKDAARVFDRLGHDVLVPLVLAMNPRKMAEILAVMQADAAERLTVALANRARGAAGPQAQAGAGLPPGELQAIDQASAR